MNKNKNADLERILIIHGDMAQSPLRCGSHVHVTDEVLNIRFSSHTDLALIIGVFEYFGQSQLLLEMLEILHDLKLISKLGVLFR